MRDHITPKQPKLKFMHDSGYYASELFFVPFEKEHPRHVDLVWPLWALFDMTPDGRGEDWFPAIDYA